MNKGLKIFITYAHKNSEAKDELIISLAVLKQNGLIDVWHDNEMLPGDKWRDEIFNNLADSDILLYLTCRYSLASENCNEELTEALSADIKVIPIILEHCDWRQHRLSDFEVLPLNGKPISKWEDPSEGWQNVTDGIRKAVRKMQSQVDSPSTTSEAELRAEVAFERGNSHFFLGQMDKAIETYSYAIELNPNDATSYSNRGAAYSKKGEFDRAIADCNKAIELNPELASAYNDRGTAYIGKGEFDRAIADCNKAIELNPKIVSAYCNLGAAYMKKGEFDRAIADCNKAIELDPEFAQAYNNLGAAYAAKREFNSAIVNFTKAIELDPDYAEAYRNRGMMWLHLQEWENFRSGFSDGRDVGIGIAIRFCNVYGSVANFEQITGIQLPEDIATMLTPSN